MLLARSVTHKYLFLMHFHIKTVRAFRVINSTRLSFAFSRINHGKRSKKYGTLYGRPKRSLEENGRVRYATLRYGTVRYGHGRWINSDSLLYSQISIIRNIFKLRLQKEVICKEVNLRQNDFLIIALVLSVSSTFYHSEETVTRPIGYNS